MHGIPATRTLSKTFSKEFRHAAPRMASAPPRRMISITAGEPSAISTG